MNKTASILSLDTVCLVAKLSTPTAMTHSLPLMLVLSREMAILLLSGRCLNGPSSSTIKDQIFYIFQMA